MKCLLVFQLSREMKSETLNIKQLMQGFREQSEEREKTRFVTSALDTSDVFQAGCYFCDHPWLMTLVVIVDDSVVNI